MKSLNFNKNQFKIDIILFKSIVAINTFKKYWNFICKNKSFHFINKNTSNQLWLGTNLSKLE